MFALNVSSVSSTVLDHFLIKFQASSTCNVGTDVFTTCHVDPANLTEYNDHLPALLAPLKLAR